MFMPISSEQLSAQAEAIKKMLAASVNSNESTDFQATGKTDNISGFATEEYTGKIDGLPITLEVTKNFPKYRELLAQLYAVQDAPGLSPFHTLSVPPDKYPGLPVRTTVELLGQKVVTTLDTVEETTLADADFVIPPGYQELRTKSQPQSSPQPSPQ
jgi:hypothetical protein